MSERVSTTEARKEGDPLMATPVSDWALVERRAERDAFIKKMQEAQGPYRRHRNLLQAAWLFLSVLSLGLGLLMSVFIAVGWPNPTQNPGKAVLVVLPLIATFCTTLMGHFRLRETCKLRELGRIKIDEIIAHVESLPLDDPTAFNTGLTKARMARVELSLSQTEHYFAMQTDVHASRNDS